jgi:LPXTG-site transpeptidase (sortase) family protein
MGKAKWLRLCERLCLIAGLLALGFYGLAKLYTYSYQRYTSYSFNEQLNNRTPSIRGFLENLLGKGIKQETKAAKRAKPPSSSPKPPKPSLDEKELLRERIYAPEVIPNGNSWDQSRLRKYMKSNDPSPGSVIGRLEIPSLDLSVMLLQGDDEWTLNRAVGHIAGTSLPGQPGNMGIAGHRDGFFRCLKDIKRDSTIGLTTLNGRFTYRVTDINVVTPKDIKVLAATKNPTLTLVTCYPFLYVGDAPKRYIVSAELIRVENPAELAAEKAGSH